MRIFSCYNLTLAITLPFLKISSSNFKIALLMKKGCDAIKFYGLMVIFDRVMPLFTLGFFTKFLIILTK